MKRHILVWMIVCVTLLGACRPQTPERETAPPETTERVWSGERLVYGESGRGRELVAYRYGQGENVLVLTFAIHGWEDSFPKDGQCLVDTAYRLMERLEEVSLEDWTVYVLPCLNPDGLAEGWTCDGPGRCTLGSDDGPGVDINRSFPYDFEPSEEARYYTGAEPLGVPEAQALADFIPGLMGEGYNVFVDTHGWYGQIIVNGGREGTLYEIFKAYFPQNEYTSLRAARGYLSGWAAYVLGFDTCLLELPPVESREDFRDRGYEEDYVNAIEALLTSYLTDG